MRLRLDVGYDGAGFAGWARQPGLRTVQGDLEAALHRVLGIPEAGGAPDGGPRRGLTCAGRTDAGVSARGQVAHVDVAAERLEAAGGVETLQRRLRAVLGDDVRLLALSVAPDGFDARFSALWRRYAYRLTDDPAGPDPLERASVVAVREPLDVDAMGAAAAALVGEHDFAAYCRRREGATTVRTLRALVCLRPDGSARGPGPVRIDAVADAFCHSMVRSLVGALLSVGTGRRPPSWPADVLAAGRRDPAVGVAPARGLVLEEVGYPPAERLAERAERARSVRGPAEALGAAGGAAS